MKFTRGRDNDTVDNLMYFGLGMHFTSFATDFDGTLAIDEEVAPSTASAVERLRASGCHTFLVTGRELEDLQHLFSRLELFDAVVAENGGLLYYPSTGAFKVLHKPPPPELVQSLLAHRVLPLSVGHVIVSTREPHEPVVLEVIKCLGLELKIVFNKGAVMLLPPGVNKASGLGLALREARLSADDCIGVGDAENDHGLLDFCGYGVAVQNALESLKEKADYVTERPGGAGVEELIDLLLSDKLDPPKPKERPLAIRQ